MDLSNDMPASMANRVGNAALWLTAARHPISWNFFTRPTGERRSPRATFSPAQGILSIASFVLFLAAIALYVPNQLR